MLMEAESLRQYYQRRCATLMQCIQDAEGDIAKLKNDIELANEQHEKALDEQEAELMAKIAALEEKLRVATAPTAEPKVIEHGE